VHGSRTHRAREPDTRSDGNPRTYLAFKLDPRAVPELPEPRPAFEIFVCSPRVEGVHLRFGPVARGGLRWSDRREDFRTEVLGLATAQAVKNAVIVPVGAKGAFVVKRPPTPTGDSRLDWDAVQTEGVDCYRMFVSGLPDLTDNLVHGTSRHPDQVVCQDGDDSYRVVAADKGTDAPGYGFDAFLVRKELVDSGKYTESWAAACELFKKAVTAEQWETAVRAARGPLGKLLSRRLDQAKFTRSLPGAPDGFSVFDSAPNSLIASTRPPNVRSIARRRPRISAAATKSDTASRESPSARKSRKTPGRAHAFAA